MTNELRDIIVPKVKKYCNNVYFRWEHENKSFPYVVYSFGNIDAPDINRVDYVIEFDIWDKSMNPSKALDLGDLLLKEFHEAYEKNESVVATFYRDMMKVVDDNDKSLQHVLVRVVAQTYKKESEING